MGELRCEAAIKPAGIGLLLAAIALAGAAGAKAQNVTVRNISPPGAFEIVNEGDEISLSTKVQVQRLQGGRWENEVTDLQLVRACNVPAPSDCITLKAREVLQPPAWNGLACASQCAAGCRGNMSLPPGTFRFVIAACSGSASVVGPPFDMTQSR
jgi:hypothetical protein